MKSLALSFGLAALAMATAVVHADTHKFVPATYYTSMSATHPAALHIKTGDRVVTSTATGASKDAARPETGPFYIDDAQPGDLIVVTIEKLEPTQATARASSNMLAATYDAEGLSNKDAATVPWNIDRMRGVVKFDFNAGLPGTDWTERFDPPTVELPLVPALGAIGVAPAADDKSGAAGQFGGEMDFSGPAIEYEIANAGGPTFSVVAKIRKAYLPRARAAR